MTREVFYEKDKCIVIICSFFVCAVRLPPTGTDGGVAIQSAKVALTDAVLRAP